MCKLFPAEGSSTKGQERMEQTDKSDRIRLPSPCLWLCRSTQAPLRCIFFLCHSFFLAFAKSKWGLNCCWINYTWRCRLKNKFDVTKTSESTADAPFSRWSSDVKTPTSPCFWAINVTKTFSDTSVRIQRMEDKLYLFQGTDEDWGVDNRWLQPCLEPYVVVCLQFLMNEELR